MSLWLVITRIVGFPIDRNKWLCIYITWIMNSWPSMFYWKQACNSAAIRQINTCRWQWLWPPVAARNKPIWLKRVMFLVFGVTVYHFIKRLFLEYNKHWKMLKNWNLCTATTRPETDIDKPRVIPLHYWSEPRWAECGKWRLFFLIYVKLLLWLENYYAVY